MAVTETQIDPESTLPYVSQLAHTLESYNNLKDIEDLSVDDIAELLVTIKRASDFAEAETGRLALLARDKGVGPHMSSRSTGDYLAHQTRTSPSHTHRIINRAETAQRFFAFYLIHDAGKISGEHLDHITRVWKKHPKLQDALFRDQDVLAEAAVTLTPAEFGRIVERWLMYVKPDEAIDDYKEKEDKRAFDMAFDFEGNLHFDGRLDPIVGESFANLIDRRVQQLFYEDWAAAVEHNATRLQPQPNSKLQLPRTHTQRRADALVSLAIDGSAVSADAQRPEPMVFLGVDEDTIGEVIEEVLNDIPDDSKTDEPADSFMADTSGNVSDSGRSKATVTPLDLAFDPKRRCETGRGTPIPPRVMLSHFLTDRIRRIVFDSNNTIIDAGRATRLFTSSQRELLKFRDRSCTFPGCTVPAHRCEADHLLAFVDGGETNLANGHMLCSYHHRLKTKGRFFVRRNKDGTISYVLPNGSQLI